MLISLASDFFFFQNKHSDNSELIKAFYFFKDSAWCQDKDTAADAAAVYGLIRRKGHVRTDLWSPTK